MKTKFFVLALLLSVVTCDAYTITFHNNGTAYVDAMFSEGSYYNKLDPNESWYHYNISRGLFFGGGPGTTQVLQYNDTVNNTPPGWHCHLAWQKATGSGGAEVSGSWDGNPPIGGNVDLYLYPVQEPCYTNVLFDHLCGGSPTVATEYRVVKENGTIIFASQGTYHGGERYVYRLEHILCEDARKYWLFWGPNASSITNNTGDNGSVTNAEAPCYTNATFTIRNNDMVSHSYTLKRNGADGLVEADFSQGYMTLAGGASGGLNTGEIPCGDVGRYALYMISYKGTVSGGTADIDLTLQPVDPTLGPAPGVPTTNAPPVPTSVNTPAPVTGSPTNNVMWTPVNTNSTAGIIQTIRDQTSVLFDAAVKGVQQSSTVAAGVATVAAGVGGTTAAVQSAGTNAVAATVAAGNQTVASVGQGAADVSGAVVFSGDAIVSAIVAADNAARANALLAQGGVTALGNGITNAAHGIIDAITNLDFEMDTNSGREVTQRGVSNILASFAATNRDTTYIQNRDAGASAGAEGSNVISGLIADGPNSIYAPGYEKGYSVGIKPNFNNWGFNVQCGRVNYRINTNPFDLDWVKNLAAFLRYFVVWALSVGLMYRNVTSLYASVLSMGATRQASASGQSVVGINLNLVTSLAMAGIITAVMLAIPFFASNWTGTSQIMSTFRANPLHHASATSTNVMEALWMLDQFFPLAFAVWVAGAAVVFRLGLSATTWGVQTVVRFCVG